jgi:hypothetical protein
VYRCLLAAVRELAATRGRCRVVVAEDNSNATFDLKGGLAIDGQEASGDLGHLLRLEAEADLLEGVLYRVGRTYGRLRPQCTQHVGTVQSCMQKMIFVACDPRRSRGAKRLVDKFTLTVCHHPVQLALKGSKIDVNTQMEQRRAKAITAL